MVFSILLFVLVGSENLLQNGALEGLEGDRPAHWDLFVLPEPGAEGGVDRETTHELHPALRLHNPDTYTKDPFNNWSQNITTALAGKTLVVGAYVRTKDAGGAAIWLQCWRKAPWGVLETVSTGDRFPMAGTADWTPVAARIEAPGETDFVTVRCVLKGRGTAWFADLRLMQADSIADAGRKEHEFLGDHAKPAQEPAAGKTREAVLEESRALKESVESLRTSNEALSKELAQMRDEIKSLRERIKGEPPPPKASETPKRHVPPLVPHGYTLEESQPWP